MKRNCLLAALMLILCIPLSAQINLWSSADLSEISNRRAEERLSQPTAFHLAKLDVQLLRAELSSIPHENQLSARNSYAWFQFPMPDGTFRTFNVVEYDMMEPRLARKFSKIKTYIGVDEAHGSKIHFNLTSTQFFGVIRDKGKTIYIDPYFKHDANYYSSYNIKDQNKSDFEFNCGVHSIVEGEVTETNIDKVEVINSDKIFNGKRGIPIALRTYRLAVSGTFEFTDYYGGTVEGAIEGITTIVNRINSVYERDAAVRLILVNDNDKVIFLDAVSDPFEDGNLGQMINQNQTTCDQLIGTANYDIGHVFGRAFYQGLAQLGAVCGNSRKARGGSVSNTPFGDSYVVNIICHEMGHQFSANHTMYHCHNVNTSTGYEPGSGTTIMSYAGICSNVADIQNNADDYFHSNSLEAIIGFSRNGGGAGCGTEIDFGNTNPDIQLDYPRTSYIPVNTAFRLEGSATDAENSNSLSYVWEQYQTGSRSFEDDPWDMTQPINNEPLFRSVPPSADPVRYLPALPRIVNEINYLFEQLPTYARDLKFRFIVRDNAAENGAAVWESMDIEVIDNSAAGQFELTNFTTRETIQTGSEVELTWTVAETDLPPLNSNFVDIYLSIDGGISFPHLIKSHTPNDGATTLNIPNLLASKFRFMIKSSNQPFLDVNNRSGNIVENPNAAIGLNYDDQYYQICAPDLVEYDISTYGMGGFTGDVHFDFVGDIPAGGLISFTKNNVAAGATTKLRLDLRDVQDQGEYNLSFIATSDGIDTVFRTIEVLVVNNNFDALTLQLPADGSSGNEFVPTLTWNAIPNADNYTLEVATDPSFNDIVFEQKNTTLSEITLDVQLEAGGVYFWRIKPRNACGLQDLNRISTFQVKSLSCEEYCSTEPTRLISQSGMPSVEMSINTGASITANDLNVTQILGQHSDMGDLEIILEGPDGTQVKMMNAGTCGDVNAPLIDMGFDDDAAIENPNCINFGDGISFVPDNPLSAMNGLSGTTYKLIINDVESGAGGKLESWCFEICGDIAPEKPLLVNADSIHLPQFASRRVNSDKLEVSHSQYGANDLTITIVEIPIHGTLLLDGVAIDAGAQLTMQDVIDNKLEYLNQSAFYETDNFSFVVTDPGGGYLGTPAIQFIIGLVATQNHLPEGSELNIFPNPSRDMLQVSLLSQELFIESVDIYTIQGKQIKSIKNASSTSQMKIDLDEIASGIYFIQVRSGQYTVVRKFVKQ